MPSPAARRRARPTSPRLKVAMRAARARVAVALLSSCGAGVILAIVLPWQWPLPAGLSDAVVARRWILPQLLAPLLAALLAPLVPAPFRPRAALPELESPEETLERLAVLRRLARIPRLTATIIFGLCLVLGLGAAAWVASHPAAAADHPSALAAFWLIPPASGLGAAMAAYLGTRAILGRAAASVRSPRPDGTPLATRRRPGSPFRSYLASRIWIGLLATHSLALAPLFALGLAVSSSRAGALCLTFVGMAFAIAVLRGRELGALIGQSAQALEQHLGFLVHGETPEAPSGDRLTRLAEVERLINAGHLLTHRVADMHVAEYVAVERTRDAERLKTQFLANMSHDLRSPLNAILGFAELLQKGLSGALSPAQQELVAKVRLHGGDLLRLINQILDVAKVENGRLELHREWIPAAECLARAVTEARKLAGKRSLDIRPELAPGLPPIQVDVRRLAQAVAAFMIRSTDAAAAAGGTGVSMLCRVRQPRADGRSVELELIDVSAEPEPLTPELVAALTEPRAQGQLVRALSTTGLALPLARRLVEMHGGRVAVSDDDPPRFVLSLPAGKPDRPSLTLRPGP